MPPLIPLALAWLAGIALAERQALPAGPCAVVGVGLAVAWLGLPRAASSSPAEPTRAEPLAHRLRPLLAVAAFLAFGAARLAMARPELGPGHVSAWNERGELSFVGRIASEPDRRDGRIDYRVELQELRPEAGTWQPAHGRVLLQAARYPRFGYGDTVLVTASLTTPPVLEDFDYRAWLARQGVHSIARRPQIRVLNQDGGRALRHGLIAAREQGRRALARALPEPEAALVTGIVLGDDRGLPAKVEDAFRTTNTTHVIAISGANMALLAGALAALLVPTLGRRRSVPLIVAVLALYSALVGADAAVVRAAVMGSLVLLAGWLGRPGHAATALLAAAWAMTAWNPWYLWDLGFQLSFAASAGLIAFAARLGAPVAAGLEGRLGTGRGRALFRLLNDAVLVTLTAQLATWPIVAWHTGQVSLAGLAANFAILPAQPAVMLLGGLTALVGVVLPPAGQLLGALAWLPTAYTIRVVEWTARLPLASVGLKPSALLILGYYVLLVLALLPAARAAVGRLRGIGGARGIGGIGRAAVGFGRRRGWRILPEGQGDPAGRPYSFAAISVAARVRRGAEGPRGVAALMVLAGLTLLVWVGALGRPDGLLHLHLLDVGQGDAILVVAPNGRRMLVDGGPGPSAVLDGIGRRHPPWDRRLDLVVLTHPDADHVGGLPAVLDRYRVAQLLAPEVAADTPDAAAWEAALAAEGARTVVAEAGGRIVLDEVRGVVATVLWPPGPGSFDSADLAAPNNRSVVLRLVYGRVAMLLTGDIEAPVEARLLAAGAPLRADLLKVAHHGSETSTSPAFLSAVAPSLALISAGADNRYGHPAPAILARLGPIPIRRSDRDGPVEVLSDGRDLWVR